MAKMQIKVWSDIACPYCYIGKRKLESALAQFPHKNNVELVWYSYELDPSLPKQALDKSIYQYFAEKNSMSEADAVSAMQKMTKLAEEVNLHYNFDKLVVANTSDALRLVKLAKEKGLATEAEEFLFEAYFVNGLDISDRDIILQIGQKVGLQQESILAMLDSDIYLSDIRTDMEYSEKELHLEYIPFYVFNNNHIVQGSISSDDYLEVLTKSYAEWEQGIDSVGQSEMITGQSCSIDGVCS